MPFTIGKKFPIVITSYEIVMNDAKYLRHYNWKYLVVDEVLISDDINSLCSCCLVLRDMQFAHSSFYQKNHFKFSLAGPQIKKFKMQIGERIERVVC